MVGIAEPLEGGRHMVRQIGGEMRQARRVLAFRRHGDQVREAIIESGLEADDPVFERVHT